MLILESDVSNLAYRSIKHNHLYLVQDGNGLITLSNAGHGLYQQDTRFISRWEVRLNDTMPLTLLSSTEAGHMSTMVYTNREMCLEDGTVVPQEAIQLKRNSLLKESWMERYYLVSYFEKPVPISLSFRVEADFRDIFEVRHISPEVHGEHLPPDVSRNEACFRYRDSTGRMLSTTIRFRDFLPGSCVSEEDGSVYFVYETVLNPLESKRFHLDVDPAGLFEPDGNDVGLEFRVAREQITVHKETWRERATGLRSDNEDFNELISRSVKDLQMLLTQDWWRDGGNGNDGASRGEPGYFIAAGVPWFSTLFGRDSLITARDCLILDPDLAKTTLKVLARFQGREKNSYKDEEPGKILHELRVGELARMGAIPHTPYYGSVDATPLWLILLHDYVLWTRDFQLLEELWPNALAALDWVHFNLSHSPNGFLVYKTESDRGLYHQGWKDSYNSAMYGDGTQAKPPLALVEVQGYVYQAMRNMAVLAGQIGDQALQEQIGKEADQFKARFEEKFWSQDLAFYAMGLDEAGNQLDVIASNPGHCLETGIMADAHARIALSRLMDLDMFSGWGIRTLSAKMPAYNPMSYHNGSIWPHDNAMIGRGFAELGRPDLVGSVFHGLYEAARHLHYKRLPELFCGFVRDPDHPEDPPVRYPVACSPQAWAASASLSLIRSMLNIRRNWESDNLIIKRPHLPEFVNYLKISNMRVGQASLTLEFRRNGSMVLVDIPERSGDISVLVEI